MDYPVKLILSSNTTLASHQKYIVIPLLLYVVWSQHFLVSDSASTSTFSVPFIEENIIKKWNVLRPTTIIDNIVLKVEVQWVGTSVVLYHRNPVLFICDEPIFFPTVNISMPGIERLKTSATMSLVIIIYRPFTSNIKEE